MVIISLGSNETGGFQICSQAIHSACNQLKSFNIRILERSHLYLTEPYGVTNQAAFTNAAITAQTNLSPYNLLAVIKKIEANAGRKPGKKWGPRVIDLDIIDYKGILLNSAEVGCGDFTHYSPKLTLPHPGIAKRPFVLQPIVDIAPFWHHPETGLTASQMLKRLPMNSPGSVIKRIRSS